MKYYYKRKLPHYIVNGYYYFITFRLANSIPLSKIFEFKNLYEKELERLSLINDNGIKSKEYSELKWNYFFKYDDVLDKNILGQDWLKETQLALIVSEALKYLDKKSYDLIAYSIMPNHVHLIIKPYLEIEEDESIYKQTYPLASIMSSIKRHSALKCNGILQRTGEFWQHENYDHIIRNEEEFSMIIEYTLNNPYKANLIDYDKNYEWNYFNPEIL